MLDATFFRRVGPNVRDRYRDHIFKKAKDVYGKPFKKYSKKYGEKKRANTFKRQASQYANSNAPVLTSDLFKDFKGFIKPRHNGVQLGYPTMGGRVDRLRKAGKKGTLTSTDKPLPDSVRNYITKEYNKYIKKNSKNTTRVHKMKK